MLSITETRDIDKNVPESSDQTEGNNNNDHNQYADKKPDDETWNESFFWRKKHPVSEKNHNSCLPIAKFLPESSGLFSFSVAAVTLLCDVTVEVCGFEVVAVEGEAWHEAGGSDLM